MLGTLYLVHSGGTKHWRRREICLGTPGSGSCTEEYPSSTEQLLRVYLSAWEGPSSGWEYAPLPAARNKWLRSASCSSTRTVAACLSPGFGPDTLCGIWKPLPPVRNPSHALGYHFLEILPLVRSSSGILSRSLFALSRSLEGFVWVILWEGRGKFVYMLQMLIRCSDGWWQGFWWLLSLNISAISLSLLLYPEARVACLAIALVHPETLAFQAGHCHPALRASSSPLICISTCVYHKCTIQVPSTPYQSACNPFRWAYKRKDIKSHSKWLQRWWSLWKV